MPAFGRRKLKKKNGQKKVRIIEKEILPWTGRVRRKRRKTFLALAPGTLSKNEYDQEYEKSFLFECPHQKGAEKFYKSFSSSPFSFSPFSFPWEWPEIQSLLFSLESIPEKKGKVKALLATLARLPRRGKEEQDHATRRKSDKKWEKRGGEQLLFLL